MKLKDQIVLVTGANRGLGEALVRASLAAGAKKIYAAARDTRSLAALEKSGEGRVVPISLDVTDAASIAAAVSAAPDVSVLINNAGALSAYGVLTTTDADLARDFAVNAFGLLAMSKAFAPALERAAATAQEAPTAALINVLSIVSLTNLPSLGGYSASKAAAYSLTQALRYELAKKRVAVHAVLAGSIDTDMVRHMEMPKTSADDVARGILRGVEDGIEDIFPEAGSQGMHAVWKRDPKELERQLATMSG